MSFSNFRELEPHPLRILLVEDSSSFAELVKAQLRITIDFPHEIFQAGRLQAAIELLRESQIDLVILDMHLPDSRGLDTYLAVQIHSFDIPVVILSSDDSVQLAIECLKAGAQDYLIKGDNDSFQLTRAMRFAIERKNRVHAQRELEAARQIQKTLLPDGNPTVCGFDIAGSLIPAVETAGDYYDFFVPMPGAGDNAFAVAVGDVSGHGLGPAMVMAEARAALHAFSLIENDPGRILELTNSVMNRSRHHHFMTLMVACIRPDTCEVSYSSAGHQGWHMSADGAVTPMEPTGPLLGILTGELIADGWPVSHLSLSPGELLLITTDGSHEARSESGEFLGADRILERVKTWRDRPASEIVEQLNTFIANHVGRSFPADDTTVVVVKRQE